MAQQPIKYRSGYKYQLAEVYSVEVGVIPETDVHTEDEYISLNDAGLLTLKKAYAWDGPSGPTIDTKNFMRGALVHDALYQLIRCELIGEEFKKKADLELKKICREDGMTAIRAWWIHKAVDKFGKPAIMPEARKRIETAPR